MQFIVTIDVNGRPEVYFNDSKKQPTLVGGIEWVSVNTTPADEGGDTSVVISQRENIHVDHNGHVFNIGRDKIHVMFDTLWVELGDTYVQILGYTSLMGGSTVIWNTHVPDVL